MAVKAVSQLHHETKDAPLIVGYSLRNIIINTAFQILDDDFGVETILDMQPTKPAGSKFSSVWFEFKISSTVPDTEIWNEHCSGLISIESTAEVFTIFLLAFLPLISIKTLS